MSERTYSQVNTGISVREASFLSPAQFDALLNSSDAEARANLLQGTAYALEADQLRQVQVVEQALMKHLLAEYDWAYQLAPNPAVVDLFALKYTYHNLKVFLKERATGRDLNFLLLDAGPYSLAVLEQVAKTFSSENCPEFMAQEVAATWQEYVDYQDIRVLEIGMDLAYFDHLKRLAKDLDHPLLKSLVTLTIDCYNVITVERALSLKKPNSFMKQLLSDAGTLSAGEVIQCVEQGHLISWFQQVNPLPYDVELTRYEEQMRSGRVTAETVEYLEHVIKYRILEQASFETDGPLPLARYLFGKELEVKNLRLVLTGLDNQLPIDKIKERMRPIYGQ